MIETKPRFRPDIRKHEFKEKGGGVTFVLEDPTSNRFFRISAYEYELLRMLDGTLTVGEAVERLKLHGRHFTLEHAAKLVEQFSRSGLLLGTPWGSSKVQTDALKRIEKAARDRSIFKLYFLYLPLIDPDRFLERTIGFWRLLVNRVTAVLFFLSVPPAIYLLVTSITRLSQEFLFFFNLENLLVLWLAIAVVKLVHEFSHAYTAKRLGLRVPEMGVVFLLFFPCLYCNTTAAWRLADRRQRMSIAAAGIMSEAVVATVSVYVWYFTNPGLLNSVAFFLMAVSLFTSLLFNANPLMKYDGYFILSDWLNMPNLQSHSFKYVRYLFLNRVLGVESVEDVKAPSEDRPLLLVYGFGAVVYRFFLYTGIVLGVYYRFDKTLGILLGGLAFTLFLVKPLITGVAGLIRLRGQMRLRPLGLAIFLLMVCAGVFLSALPWSSNSVYPCYLESARVRRIVIPSNAPVLSVEVREGDRVKAGETILRLRPEPIKQELLEAERNLALIRGRISIIEHTGKELSSLPVKLIELSQTRDAVGRVRAEMANLTWRAPFDGTVISLKKELQPGAWFEKGTVVGELADEADCKILALVPESDIRLISPGEDVDVWFPLREGGSFRVKVAEISPFRREDLKGSPFSSRFGGEIATKVKDDGRKDSPLEAHYLCEINFPNTLRIPLGMTGRLIVHHPPRSTLRRLVERAYAVYRREILF